MLSNVRASSARVTLRSFIASSSRPSACRFRLSYPSNSRTHFVRTLASNGAQLDSLADLISDTAAKSDYNPTPDSRKEGKPKSCSVFLGNLPQSIDEKFIRKQLDGFPGIDDARFYIVRDYAGLSVGYGFVEFDSPAHADELVRLMAENWVIKDKKISLQISNGKIKPKSYYRGPPSRTIVLKPLPPSADLKTVREVFAGFEGVTNIRFATFGDKSKGRLGFAHFTTVKDARLAMNVLAASDLTIDHRIIKAMFANNGDNKVQPESRILRINGLGEDKDRLYRMLREHHCENGVTRINFGKDDILVQFFTVQKANHARRILELHNGASLSVNYAQSMDGGPPLLRVPRSTTIAPPRGSREDLEELGKSRFNT